MTPLDTAHAAMAADTDSDAKRLTFYGQLAGSELHLLLSKPPDDDDLAPEVFETGDGPMVLAFDTEDRLTAFTGAETDHAILSGRKLAGLLAGQGVGLGLNLDVAPSAMLLPASAVNWLHRTLGARPDAVDAIPSDLSAPAQLPDALIQALDARLAAAAGLARQAYLAAVTYDDGRKGHLLAVVDAAPGAQAALAETVSEALIFSGLDAGELDVTFVARSDQIAAKLAKVGLRFDLPQPAKIVPVAPGSDPAKPPKLR